MKFKNRNQARTSTDQYIRFRLLELASSIIEKSYTLQEFFEGKSFEKRKIGSRWETHMLDVIYYAFIAIVNQSRIKVVVKQIENGQKFFWSLVPFWKTHQKNSGTKKILHSGNLEEV